MEKLKNAISESKSRIIFQVFNYALLIFLAAICFLPLINLWAISFSQPKFVEAGLVNLFPKGFTSSSYQYIFSNNDLLIAFGNSLLLLLIGVPWTLLVTVLAAYPISRPEHMFVGRRVYIVMIWICMLFSGGLVADYMLRCALKLQNSIWALILPGVPIFNVILLMNFFKQLPEEFHEAAELDGANEFYILLKIYVPLSKSAMLTILLFTVVDYWNQWLPGVMYMSTIRKMPLQSYLQSVTVNIMDLDINNMLDNKSVSQNTIEAARFFLSVIPMLLVYLPLQKYFIQGLTVGGVKG